MKISSNQYFAVESLAHLANWEASRPCPTEVLAGSINRSLLFTEELMAELADAGLVTKEGGPHAGYCLRRPAHRISVAEVFRAFDASDGSDDGSSVTTSLSQSEIDALSGTSLLWEALNSYVLLFLEGVSLADIAPKSNQPLSGRVSQTLH